MNPFFEHASPWPARWGAAVAGILVLALSFVACFVLAPPRVTDWTSGRVVLSPVLLLEQIRWMIDAQGLCSAGWAAVVSFDCWHMMLRELLWHSALASVLLPRVIVVALAVGTALIVAADRIGRATPRRDGLTHLSGRRLQQDAAGRTSLRQALGKLERPEPHHLWLLPHVQLPGTAESYNILAVGTQGSGKSGLLRAWTEQLIERGDRVVVHDVKGDMTAGLPVDRFILVAPHDARSAAWDIARDVQDQAAALEFATRSVAAGEADSMWANGARALWADAVMSLVHERGQDWTLRDLYLRLVAPADRLQAALVASGAASSELIAFDESGGVQRTSMSLLITLWIAAFTTLKPLVDAWDAVPPNRRFSLSGWLADNSTLPKVIVIQKSASYPELSALVGGLLVERLAGLVSAPGRERNPKHKIALVLDELVELGKLPKLGSMLAVGREQGLVTIAAVQDLGQLTHVYGEKEGRVIESRFGIKVVGRLSAGDTADRVSRQLIGERLVAWHEPQVPASTTSQPPTRHQESYPVFPPERLETDLGVRPARKGPIVRCLVLGLGDPALLDIPFTTWPDRRPAHRPARWLTAGKAASTKQSAPPTV